MISVSSVQEYHTRKLMKKNLTRVVIAFLAVFAIFTTVSAGATTNHIYQDTRSLVNLKISINWTTPSGEYEGYNRSVTSQSSIVRGIKDVTNTTGYSLKYSADITYYSDLINANRVFQGHTVTYTYGSSSRIKN